MFCKNCGKEIVDNSLFCTFCGAEQGEKAPMKQGDGTASIFHSVCASNNFHLLTLFFLISVCASALISVAAGTLPLPIIEIFIIVALFKLEKLAKSGSPLSEFASPLKTFRVIIKIYQVLSWIVAVILFVCGVITLFAGGALAGGGIATLADEFLAEVDLAELEPFVSALGGMFVGFLGIIFIVIGVVMALLNIFMYGSFFKTAESAELSAKTGDIYFTSLSTTRAWLIVSAVLNGISALSSLGDGVTAVLGFVAAGFQIAFTVFAIKALDNLKNYRQNEIL